MIGNLAKEMYFEKPKVTNSAANLSGLTFVITGSLEHFTNRDEAKDKIESLGGKVSGSVSAKTSYLVNNDVTSTSGKNKKAKELNIPIISEEELIKMLS
jgi:DNA ligase (NAD+)